MCQALRALICSSDPAQPHLEPPYTHGLALFKPSLVGEGVIVLFFPPGGVEGCKFGERAELLLHAGGPAATLKVYFTGPSASYTLAVLEISTPSWIVGTHLMEEQLFVRKRLGEEKSSWCGEGEGFTQQMCFWER